MFSANSGSMENNKSTCVNAATAPFRVKTDGSVSNSYYLKMVILEYIIYLDTLKIEENQINQ